MEGWSCKLAGYLDCSRGFVHKWAEESCGLEPSWVRIGLVLTCSEFASWQLIWRWIRICYLSGICAFWAPLGQDLKVPGAALGRALSPLLGPRGTCQTLLPNPFPPHPCAFRLCNLHYLPEILNLSSGRFRQERPSSAGWFEGTGLRGPGVGPAVTRGG